MTPKAISFTPDALKAKLRALGAFGRCQTRRPVRCNIPSRRPVANVGSRWTDGRLWVAPGGWVRPPLGLAGQLLWVRERARVVAAHGGVVHTAITTAVTLEYALDGARRDVPWPDRLSAPTVGHCIPNGVFREGTRHFLEVAEVGAERVAEISEQDALSEGIRSTTFIPDDGFPPSVGCMLGRDDGKTPLHPTASGACFALCDSIYGAGAHARDWCWVYTLKRAEP